MLIDWFTVAAQVVNFLILVWILKHFLYGPIVGAMRKRQETIAQRVEEARRDKEEAQNLREELEAERDRLAQEREEVLATARREADEHKALARQRTKDEVQQMREAWERRLVEEQQAFYQEVQKRLVEGSLAVARRAVADLSGERFEAAVATTLLSRLREIPEDELASLSAKEVAVFTSHDLDPELAEEIGRTLDNLLPGHGEVQFVRDPDRGPGLALRVGEHKLEWSLEDYLRGLEREVLAEILPADVIESAESAEPADLATEGGA